MGAGHDHGVPRRHARARNRRRLAWTLGLIFSYMVAEVVGGILSGSLALLADAGHMLSDAAALALALFAMYMSAKPASPRRTYGLYRGEILAALANGGALIALSLYVFVEAWRRLSEPAEVEAGMMLGVAAGGLAVNLLALWILREGRSESLNVRGAWLHVVGDTLGSVGAIGSALLIAGFGWLWADPVASVLIACLVMYSSWALLKETVSVLMESAPGHIDVDELRGAMVGAQGVVDVHDLHVWTITSGIESLSAHVVIEHAVEARGVLAEMRLMLHERFGIDHITLQIEPEGFEERPVPF
jgi:cobalt-zinc-cadmium efflux system protein